MTPTKKPQSPPRETQERVKKRVQAQDPAAWSDAGAAPGKSPDQQRRDSPLEAGRPKDSGRCGA
jgi:hypothetical protein